MGSLSWLRWMRRIPGLGVPKERANLEAFLEMQEAEAGHGLDVARWLIPLGVFSLGMAASIWAGVALSPFFLLGLAPTLFGAVAAGVWLNGLCARLGEERIILKRRAAKVMEKIRSWRHVLGLEQAVSPRVADMLDRAAEAFLRFVSVQECAVGDPYADMKLKALRAMQAAMARMLELAEPEGPRAQELLLEGGWADALLDEMRAMAETAAKQAERDRRLEERMDEGEPLAGLREARAGFERLEVALEELEQESRG